jgi:DNA-directed RNA polymerase subunit N (RpoN/RPB10)
MSGFPVACFSCGRRIGRFWLQYEERVRTGETPEQILNHLYCGIYWKLYVALRKTGSTPDQIRDTLLKQAAASCHSNRDDKIEKLDCPSCRRHFFTHIEIYDRKLARRRLEETPLVCKISTMATTVSVRDLSIKMSD